MSVVIKGMKMPANCAQCSLRVGHCKERMYMEHRPDNCPLVDLGSHGRLIDADALLAELQADGAYGYVDAKQIADAETILDAEEVNE